MTSSAETPVGRDTGRAEGYVGMALYGSVAAGLAGLGLTILPLFFGEFLAAAIGAVAAAIAFGGLANALLRH
jgi:hypothetical protein